MLSMHFEMVTKFKYTRQGGRKTEIDMRTDAIYTVG